MPVHYPKQLPQLAITTTYDNFNLSAAEKVALKNAMRMIDRKFRWHTNQIYLDFFSKNETEIDSFRLNDRIQTLYMTQHVHTILNMYNDLIFKELTNPNVSFKLLTQMTDDFRSRGISEAHMQAILYHVRDHLLTSLKYISSVTLKTALTKLTEQIIHFNKHDRLKSIQERNSKQSKILNEEEFEQNEIGN